MSTPPRNCGKGAGSSSLALLVALLLVAGPATAQQQEKIKINITSDLLRGGTQGRPDRFSGNVYMTHDNMRMWCDSLLRHPGNIVEAFGNVRAIQNDSIHLDGDYIHYDGNTRFAQVRGNVTLKDPSMTLTTHFLDYDGIWEFGYYFNKGRLVDVKNTLDSQRGYYFTQTKIANFVDSVTVDSPEYMIFSDTLKYSTATNVVSIVGPTRIYGKGDENNTLYSEDGWYDTARGHAELYRNNLATHAAYTARADTMIMDSVLQQVTMLRHVIIHDTVNKVIVKGEYAMTDQLADFSYVTREALLILVGERDSLFQHGDTLFVHKDTLGNHVMSAHHHVRFFSRDLQGVCDSMVYLSSDSTVTLYNDPVAWASGNQLKGETVSFVLSDGQAKEFHLKNDATMISRREQTEMFDQITGRTLTGYFHDNEIYKIEADGNGETIYFVDDNGLYYGPHSASAPRIMIKIRDRQVTDITYYNSGDGAVTPLFMVQPSETRLKNFTWLEYLRPLDKNDIYTTRPSPTAAPLENTPPEETPLENIPPPVTDK
ncbi:MAG: organic solvent tolerance protein OstA [Odoribacteraceae bacterium]|jgi:lipopolysaccharide export system protein LptA|nr:organic solvent tolerance protein OstA [Odoribacteraceae bacterium]